MSQYRLYTGGPYKQRNGSAITSSSTDINGGAAKNLPNSETLTRSNWRTGSPKTAKIAGVLGVGFADLTSVGNGTADSVGGLVSMSAVSNHGLSVGDLILLDLSPVDSKYGDSFGRVVSVSSTSAFTTNIIVPNLNSEGGIAVSKVLGTFAASTPENFTMKRHNATVHGQANTTLRSGAADFGRSRIHRVNAVRTRKIVTALRNGTWNIFTGTFSSLPSTSNDYQSFDNDGTNHPDDESKRIHTGYGVGGEFAFKYGGRTVQQADYRGDNT